MSRSALVWTSWDLGVRDATAIWFAQVIGREIRIIDYYEASGVDLGHYVREINAAALRLCRPHRAARRAGQELGTGKSRLEVMESLGLRRITLAPLHRVEDGINAVRMFLPKCWFDEEKCARGVDALKLYRADYDRALQALRPQPVHDWTSHAADSFRYLAHDARPPGGAEGLSSPDRVRAAGGGVTVFRREASATLHPHTEERTQCASRSTRPNRGPRVRWSRVPAECSERACASGTRAGTQRKKVRSALAFRLVISRVALGPGSRCARPGHEGGIGALALTDFLPQRADQCSRTAGGTRNGLRRMPNTGRRCAPPGAAIARRTSRSSASAGGSGCKTTRIFASASAPAAVHGSAGNVMTRSTGSRWSITTPCANGRTAFAPSASDPAALSVGHCHACGKVRGLLCGKCNSVRGFCDDRPAHLLMAAAYLRASCDHAPASSVTSVAAVETERRASADGRHCRCAGKAL